MPVMPFPTDECLILQLLGTDALLLQSLEISQIFILKIQKRATAIIFYVNLRFFVLFWISLKNCTIYIYASNSFFI